MVDIPVNKNSRGLTYELADYAKSVNGGKPVKLNSQKWASVMKIIADINSKRSADNAIFTGGTNLFGNANKNFVIASNTIHFSDAEMALILKEMGVEAPAAKEKPDEDFNIKGLSIEHQEPHIMSNLIQNKISVNPEILENMPSGFKDIAENINQKSEEATQPQAENNLQPQFFNWQKPGEFSKTNFQNFGYEYMSASAVKEGDVTVTSARDSINLAPPFMIRTPLPGPKGGGTKTISEAFHKRALEVADKIGCKYEDLITVINFESGMDPAEGSKNPKKRPVGLIQFTGSAIRALNKTYGMNLTKDAIVKMSELEQLDLVEKYFEMSKKNSPRLRNKKELDAADLYSLTILPNRAGRDILCKKGEKDNNGNLLSYYESNAGIDVGGDGIITRQDVLAKLDEFRIDVMVV